MKAGLLVLVFGLSSLVFGFSGKIFFSFLDSRFSFFFSYLFNRKVAKTLRFARIYSFFIFRSSIFLLLFICSLFDLTPALSKGEGVVGIRLSFFDSRFFFFCSSVPCSTSPQPSPKERELLVFVYLFSILDFSSSVHLFLVRPHPSQYLRFGFGL